MLRRSWEELEQSIRQYAAGVLIPDEDGERKARWEESLQNPDKETWLLELRGMVETLRQEEAGWNSRQPPRKRRRKRAPNG